jgi:DNA repair protein RadA/Sms
MGRCAECGAWNSIVEDDAETGAGVVAASGLSRVADLATDAGAAIPTGIEEFDRVLSGGLVAGSVTLVGGEPGIGKSTLLLQVAAAVARSGRRALLVSAEESAHQVRLRAARLDAAADDLWLASDTDMARVLAAVSEIEPAVVVVDSIQTVRDTSLTSAAGSVVQVQACAHALVEMAKRCDISVVLVGHVTKDGNLAGPRALEHLVDTVLAFEGERHHALRLLRALKHRFGTTGELGLFEMQETGLAAVSDPSGLFLGDRRVGAPGSVVVPAMEGRRPLLVEVQALVMPSDSDHARVSGQGVDTSRVAMLAAVLDRHANVKVGRRSVYASAVGGVRVDEPAVDLAVALALASSFAERAVPADLIACGEVGLAGEVRAVPLMARRLVEAARLGFSRALVPGSTTDGPAGLELVRVRTVRDALDAAGVRRGASSPSASA